VKAAPAPAKAQMTSKPVKDAGAEPAAPEAAKPAPRARRGTAKPKPVQKAVPKQAKAPPAAPAPAAPPADITAPADGSLFGRYVIALPDEERAELHLRTPYPGTALCSCLDFALSEDASCPHVQALDAFIATDPGRAAARARGPQAVGSRIEMLHGARRRLLWLPGLECPTALNELADELLGVPADAMDDRAVPRLRRAAREVGHDLSVDESVWTHLAAARDARWRVQRLESLLPQGPDSPVLQALRPLLPLQWEGALFAVCAGRCILADCAPLQPEQQALAAVTLWRRHFGLQRVLVLTASAALDRWRRELPADDLAFSLTAIDNLVTDAELHRSLAPELVIVDEPAEGGLWVDAERAAALLRLQAHFVIVLPGSQGLQRLAEWPLRLAFVDTERRGPYAALLDSHGVRDDAGQLCGLHDADDLPATLPSVLLARSLDQVRSQLPERLDRVQRVEMPLAERDRHDGLLAALRDSLAFWQAADWLPDAQQRQLQAQVQALRGLCAGVDAPTVAQLKARAVQAVLAEAETPLVVFSQWPQALDALRAALADIEADADLPVQVWRSSDALAVRQSAQRQFESGQGPRLLLVADPGSATLSLRCPDARVLHLDRPWNPGQLQRRFGHVHAPGLAHLVPVTQLLLDGSFEAGVFQCLAERPEPVCELLDADAADGFLQGADLRQWLADLAQVLTLSVPGPSRSGSAH